jgi:hypothetical protein
MLSTRDINIKILEYCSLRGSYYPSVFLNTQDGIYYPIREKTMSLSSSDIDIPSVPALNVIPSKNESTPVFFFIYNTDNYFHFLYDSLPILYSYFDLKSKIPNLKLLMNPKRKYPFIYDCLSMLDIKIHDIIIANEHTLYDTIHVSNSLTHDGMSNEPPHSAVWEIYNRMKLNSTPITNTPKKFYISRRTWIHGDTSNIGTNYTTRRKLENEDDLVKRLQDYGYEEVFCEKLTMNEKIQYFSNATHIVGAIGGGMCNCVFANPSCKVISINSPEFIKINKRFLYTMNHTNLINYDETLNTSNLYRRVRFNNLFGEIISIEDSKLTINIGEVGWNADDKFEQITVKESDVIYLDNGLNSPWTFSVDSFMNTYELTYL